MTGKMFFIARSLSLAIHGRLSQLLSVILISVAWLSFAIDNDGMGRMNEYAAWKFQESPIPGQQFGGKGVEYAEFVMEVVKPFIDETYRTKADRQHTAMIGSSLGGNITQFIGLEYQDQIGCLGIFSSANWLHPRSL